MLPFPQVNHDLAASLAENLSLECPAALAPENYHNKTSSFLSMVNGKKQGEFRIRLCS